MANNNESKETIQKRLETDFFAEKRLLRALYNNPEYFDDDRVDIDLMSSQSTKNIYQSLQNLRGRGITATHESLQQEYSIIDLDANSYIVDVVADDSVKNEDLTDIIDQLKDFKKRREATDFLKKATKLVESSARLSDEDIEKVQEYVSQAENKITANKVSDYQDTMTFSQWFNDYYTQFMKRRYGKVYWFRNYMLDSLIPDGPQPGEIGIIASASGSGKSTVCLNLINSFIECKIPTMYYSLEMSGVATMDRLLAKRAGITYSKLKDPGEDFDAVLNCIDEQRKDLEDNYLFRFCQSGEVNLKKIEKDIVKFQKEAGVQYCIVVIDLLSMVKDFVKFFSGMNMAQGIEIAINELSNLAKKLGVHIIGVLQLNRSAEAESSIHSVDDLDKLRPNRAQIKNANAFLERSRYVVTTFRKRMYAKLFLSKEEYEDLEDEIELSIVKMNNGELGEVVKGIFDGEHFNILPIEVEVDPMEDQDSQFD